MPRWTKALGSSARDEEEGDADVSVGPLLARQGSEEDAKKIEAQLKSEGSSHIPPSLGMPPPPKDILYDASRRDSLASPGVITDSPRNNSFAWLVVDHVSKLNKH